MDATSLALDHLLRATGDPADDLRGIEPGHPEFARAQTIRAATGVIAKSPGALPALAEVIRTGAGPAASPRTRAHLAAAEAWLAGDPVLAAGRYAAILDRWPHDLLALRLAQSCYFFLGWHERLCSTIDAAMRAWSRDQPGYPALLAIASFAHAENGDAARAEALGREALASDASCPMGVHSVAHAIAESGRPRKGAQWMRDQREQWHTDSRMCTHNAWHLAMFDADAGNLEPALGILDRWLLPASDESEIEACDATGLLWRLTAEGVADGGRWMRISGAFERNLEPGFWPFVDLHAALAHFAAGQQARALRLVDAIERRSEGRDYAAQRAGRITLPGLRALVAWSEGRHAEASSLFLGLQPVLAAAGGSRVQLEVLARIGRAAVRSKQPTRGLHMALMSETSIV
ncbi:MAG TPA: hypothetical protein VFK92_00785 [Burkholderiales bacterium]|nr:hypothetical protein [Burkholderiales bacterium]